MTEHVCEWILGGPTDNFIAFCKYKHCPELMGFNEAQARLNATERLNAERARVLLGDYPETYQENSQAVIALRAYADILEGEDE